MTEIRKFTKKPVTIDAVQWDGTAEGATPIIDWILAVGDCTASFSCTEESHAAGVHGIAIHTLEGTMTAQPDDWVIRGIKGEFYPCKPDIFADTYEEAAS